MDFRVDFDWTELADLTTNRGQFAFWLMILLRLDFTTRNFGFVPLDFFLFIDLISIQWTFDQLASGKLDNWSTTHRLIEKAAETSLIRKRLHNSAYPKFGFCVESWALRFLGYFRKAWSEAFPKTQTSVHARAVVRNRICACVQYCEIVELIFAD